MVTHGKTCSLVYSLQFSSPNLSSSLSTHHIFPLMLVPKYKVLQMTMVHAAHKQHHGIPSKAEQVSFRKKRSGQGVEQVMRTFNNKLSHRLNKFSLRALI